MSEPINSRNFRRVWASAGSSSLGDSVADVAIPLVAVLTLGATTWQVSLLVAAEQAGWLLLGLAAGVWVDRWSRRRVLVVANLLRAMLLVSIPLLAVADQLGLAALYLITGMSGALLVFSSLAQLSVLPAVVPKSDLVAANSRIAATTTAADMAGKAGGGVLVQLLTAPLSIAAASLTALASAIFAAGLDEAPRSASGAGTTLRGNCGRAFTTPGPIPCFAP